MTEALYLEDSYLKEFEATVVAVVEHEGKSCAILDQTAFYPIGGGQPHDTGTLTVNGVAYTVVDVRKGMHAGKGAILHVLDREGLKEGDAVQGSVDWERRYKLMRMHTASHALCAVIHDALNAKITGHQLEVDKSRIDFNLEDFDKEKLKELTEECNKKLAQHVPVTFSWMKREEALNDPVLVKLANVLPPAVKELRIVDIHGIDRQADGGTHVKNTEETGNVRLTKFENKGKERKRIYFELEE